jgi:hypothetical protein
MMQMASDDNGMSKTTTGSYDMRTDAGDAVGGGKLHELACSFRFFFIQDNEDEEGHTLGKTASDLLPCGEITTVESFWAYYSNMLKPSDLPSNFDVCFFKDGYQPLCEEKANIGGGKWTARLRKGQVRNANPKH